MFDFVKNPVYLLVPLAIGYFTDGPLRLWLSAAFIVSPVLLWLSLDGSEALGIEEAIIPMMLLTAGLIAAGAILARLKRKAQV